MNLGLEKPAIASLKGMGPDKQADSCGPCHVTLAQGVFMGIDGITADRFPPYRLAGSPCYDEEDPRIGCIACHDRHETLVEDASYYDSKCLARHLSDVGVLARRRLTCRRCPSDPRTSARATCSSMRSPGRTSSSRTIGFGMRIARRDDLFQN